VIANPPSRRKVAARRGKCQVKFENKMVHDNNDNTSRHVKSSKWFMNVHDAESLAWKSQNLLALR